MRHQHESAWVFIKARLQAFDGRQIEVIGGLVEQQQIRLTDQNLGQLQPAALAAGQRAQRAAKIGL